MVAPHCYNGADIFNICTFSTRLQLLASSLAATVTCDKRVQHVDQQNTSCSDEQMERVYVGLERPAVSERELNTHNYINAKYEHI